METIKEWISKIDFEKILADFIALAALAILTWIGSKIWHWIIKSNKKLREEKEERDIIKMIIHKRYVNRNGMYYFTFGYLFIIKHAMRNLFMGLFIFFGFLCLDFQLDFKYFGMVGAYFCMIFIYRGYDWLIDRYDEKQIKKFNSEKVKEIENEFIASEPFLGDEKK